MAYTSFDTLLEAAAAAGSIAAAATERESSEAGITTAEVRTRMAAQLAAMREAVELGLSGETRSRSGWTGGDAALVYESSRGPLGDLFTGALSRALAVGEVNAAMGRIVAAPTGGASGVVPGVLLTVAERLGCDDDTLIDGLLTCAAIGGIIASRATLSGAAGGCQAEIGSAAAMAAAAVVEMNGGSPACAGHAASLALQGLLGLACDPVGGLVEVPCVVRNATGAAVALAGAQMALAGVKFPIPFDDVVDAAAQVGRSLPPSLRETALGGLAATTTGRKMAREASGGPE
ncbi:MAG: L-serine ammonia-lyase, iron-sulfur-dependent, subunit alpha [Actinomycetota bacterium]|nr:L-serine ammonia-lyase, iron-sulfur-dependent, subunit alpha [Actinomycetota bacterium]MDZ4179557.1 L-serine ammonia-lyase, iron-sulfur-dependent, subunit alpha [Coriobacteriia bacterium]